MPPRPGVYRNSLGFESVFQRSLTDEMASGRWQELVANMGVDMAESVRQTLAGLTELARTHRIGKHEARWLQEPLQRLYQAGVSAQKLSHLVDRSSTAAHEAVALDELVADAVSHHQQKFPTHNIVADLTQLDVVAEPEALASAMDALLAWGVHLGRELNVRLVRHKGTPRGEVWLRVSRLNDRAHETRHLNSLNWYVLWQLARLKSVKVRRKVEGDRIRVIVQFDRVMHQHSGMAVLEMDRQEETPSFDPAVTEVWMVLPRGNLASTVMATLRPRIRNLRALGDLRTLADSTLVPHCVVSTSEILDTEAFRYWRRCAQEVAGRTIAVIEITPVTNVFDVGGFGSRSMARISASSVAERLVPAIVFEMSHVSGEAL